MAEAGIPPDGGISISRALSGAAAFGLNAATRKVEDVMDKPSIRIRKERRGWLVFVPERRELAERAANDEELEKAIERVMARLAA